MVICSKLKYNIHEVLDFFNSFYENTLYEYIAEGDGAKFYVLTQCNCGLCKGGRRKSSSFNSIQFNSFQIRFIEKLQKKNNSFHVVHLSGSL